MSEKEKGTEMKSVDCTERREGVKSRVIMVGEKRGWGKHRVMCRLRNCSQNL
jgi:hypothetical protein